MAYIVVASWSVAPEAWDEVAVALREARTAMRDDPGCLAYEVHAGIDDPHHVLVYESYRDHAAFEAHLKSDVVARLSAALRGRISDGSRSAYRIL